VRRQQCWRRGLAGLGLVAALATGAAACGSSGSSASSVDSPTRATAHPTIRPAGTPGMQTVEYLGVAFDVPADWAVHDLANDPTTCVRFDVHAVYVGTPGADMRCPAGLVGRTDSLLVEPASSANARAVVSAAGTLGTQSINGVSVQVADGVTATGDLVATTDAVTATVSTGDSDEVARRIVASFRAAGS
jgi:hypothetical protein